MTRRISTVLLTLAALLLAYQLMVWAFHLMNQPSDVAFYGGIAVLVSALLGLSVSLYRLWRRQ